jgi:AhpD family alkylhydroperoxidase
MLIKEELVKMFFDFENATVAPGHLDVKTKELMAVACAIMADCIPCLEVHWRAAAKAGATVDEAKEAIAVAIAISGGNKIGKFSLKAAELFREEL